jgi:hypothetical protein
LGRDPAQGRQRVSRRRADSIQRGHRIVAEELLRRREQSDESRNRRGGSRPQIHQLQARFALAIRIDGGIAQLPHERINLGRGCGQAQGKSHDDHSQQQMFG